MNRRTAVATAGAITVTLLAGSTALAANLGILERRNTDTVGELSPVSDTFATTDDSTVPSVVETIVVDDTTDTSAPEVGTTGVTVDDHDDDTTDVTVDDDEADDDELDDDTTDVTVDDDEADDVSDDHGSDDEFDDD